MAMPYFALSASRDKKDVGLLNYKASFNAYDARTEECLLSACRPYMHSVKKIKKILFATSFYSYVSYQRRRSTDVKLFNDIFTCNIGVEAPLSISTNASS